MPNFRASYYFGTKDNEGWSENFYMTGADIATEAALAANYISVRRSCSTGNVDMVYGKISDVAVKGDSLIILPMSGNYPFVGTYTEDPVGAFLEANTALLIEMLAWSVNKNRLFLRGLSLDVVTGREYKAPSGFVTALTALTTFLVGTFVVRKQVVPHTVPPSYTYTTME